MDKDLQHYSFHATWNLEDKLAKPFNILMQQIDQHIKDETHETFVEEGLLFKSYLYMSGIGEKSNKDKKRAAECVNEVINLLEKWDESPKKDGFLAVAYALEAWIDMDKTESRLQDLHKLYQVNRNEARKPFEAAIHFIKGYSLSRLGGKRYLESIEEFRQATEKCPDNPEYLFSVALMTRRFYGPTKELETILRTVLSMKNDYLYAKVELANLFCNLDENISGAIKLLEEVTTTINSSECVTPENMKILGHTMKIYLQINREDTDKKIKDIYTMVVKSGGSSFVSHQRALLARKTKNWSDYQKFLKEAEMLNPFNVIVKLELTKHILTTGNKSSVEHIIHTYEEILHKHDDDNFAMVKIYCDFGVILQRYGCENKAILRYEKAMDIAIKYGQLNCHDKSQIKVFPDIVYPVMVLVRNINKIYKSDIHNPEVILKMIKLQYNLRNTYLTCVYCKQALQMELQENQKYEVTHILAEIKTNLSSDLDSLAEVDSHVEIMKKFAKGDDKLKKVGKLEADLSVKKAILHERRALYQSIDQQVGSTTVISEYCKAARSGHKVAIMRLFSALEVMNKTNPTFYETCAYLEIGINEFCTEDDDMQKKLRLILEEAASGDLKRLRNQQLEMEKAIIKQTDQLVAKIEYVIQTSRNLLNSTMHKLEGRYRKSKFIRGQNTLDFFCIHQNFDKRQTEKKVRAQLKKYNWIDTDDELITFLVEIQPCTNPKVNNWIMAFMEFNNITKHQREAKQYGTYKVYPEDDSGQYQDKEYSSIDLARTVCSNIAYILDNLNEFSDRFE